MKRYINLLPPDEQKEITAAVAIARVSSFGFWLLVSVAVLAALLLAAGFTLTAQLRAANETVAASEDELAKFEQSQLREEVGVFNQDLRNFQTLAAGKTEYSEALREFASILPTELTLDRFAILEDGRVEVMGRGATRTSALRLRQNVLGSPHFEGINFPLKNLEKARDGEWNYRFSVKK